MYEKIVYVSMNNEVCYFHINLPPGSNIHQHLICTWGSALSLSLSLSLSLWWNPTLFHNIPSKYINNEGVDTSYVTSCIRHHSSYTILGMSKVARAIFAPFNIRSPRYTMNMDNSRSTRSFVFTVGWSYILIVSGDTGTLDNRKVVHCFNSCSGITVESEKVKSVFVTSCRVNRVSIIGKNLVRIFAVREKEPCG